MCTMSRLTLCCLLIIACVSLCSAPVFGITIETIQYTTATDGTSDYHDSIVDCTGGIVIGKFDAYYPRIQIYDPANPDSWGAIQIKDWTAGAALYNAVALGDWISFTDIYVEDSEDATRGTTFLQYDPDYAAPAVAYSIDSTANSLPEPLLVAASAIAAPTQDTPEFWYVADRSAEKYESMLLKILDVTVTQMGMGAKDDVYNLQTTSGDNVWAADYLNTDAVGDYDTKVSVGQHFDSVTGMLEQYTKVRDTYGWDYYQLLTRSTDDLVVPEPASMFLLAFGAAWLISRRRP